MLGLRGWQRRLGLRSNPALIGTPPDPESLLAEPLQEQGPPLQQLARDLGDGDACPAALRFALDAEIGRRRARADLAAEPASPHVGDLVVRRADLPEWWAAGDNLLLAHPALKIPEMRLNPFKPPAANVVVVLGARVIFNHFNLGGEGALMVIGDDVHCAVGAMNCLDASTVLIGEGVTATNWAMLDARHDGIILAGEDGMWAHGVSLMTDDTHAIRDMTTGRRLNTRGGRIVLDRHVWLGESARVLGGAQIGHDSVVGAGAMVKNCTIPANSICVGSPARVVRSGVTWNREDAP